MSVLPAGGLYAITPPALSGAALCAAAQLALAGGAVLLQYRAKPPVFADAQALAELCKVAGVPLIINDSVAIAQRLQCGVHLGEADGAIEAARAALGAEAIIGASCYDRFELAEKACAAGASYVAFGAFFETRTKVQPRRAELELLTRAQQLAIPCVAIGGIELSNAATLIDAGADFIAVVHGVFGQADIAKSARALSALFDGEAGKQMSLISRVPLGSHDRRIRSFVLRQGRLTQGQARAMRELMPRFGIKHESGLFALANEQTGKPFALANEQTEKSFALANEQTGKPLSLANEQTGKLSPQASALDFSALFGRTAPVVLEIGIGNGEALTECAKNDPARNYLGAEVHAPGVGHALLGIESNALSNARIFHGDAVHLLQNLVPNHSIDQINIWFPDPWHKARHHKRRLIQPDFVALLASKLRPGGTLHLATDWEAYAVHMLSVLSAHDSAPKQPIEWLNAGASATGFCAEKPAWRPNTHFERRGERLGHGVWDLLFRTAVRA
jgi:tRNA (guanine-N7-)-methyltransferase